MSDFVSDFWNLYVVVIVVASILACVILLVVQGKATFTPGKTMGHVWDGDLEEYNNPMPRWWTWMFVITVSLPSFTWPSIRAWVISRACSAGLQVDSTRLKSLEDIKQYIHLRHTTPALKRGTFRIMYANEWVVVYQRQYRGQTAVIAFNMGDREELIIAPPGFSLHLEEKLNPAGQPFTANSTMTLPPKHGRIWVSSS